MSDSRLTSLHKVLTISGTTNLGRVFAGRIGRVFTNRWEFGADAIPLIILLRGFVRQDVVFAESQEGETVSSWL